MFLPVAVFFRECSVLVFAFGLVVLVCLLSRRARILPLAKPVVFIGSGVDVMRDVMVVVGGQHNVKSFGEKISLAVFERRYQRVSFPVLLSENDVLVYSGLYLFVEIAVVESDHQAVGPSFVYDSDFPDYGFVVELVVEALDMVNFVSVRTFSNPVFAEFRNVIVYVVIVVREVLKGIAFIGRACLEGLPEMYV